MSSTAGPTLCPRCRQGPSRAAAFCTWGPNPRSAGLEVGVWSAGWGLCGVGPPGAQRTRHASNVVGLGLAVM